MRKCCAFALCLLLVLPISCKRTEFATGQAAFEGKCVKCHRLNGKGGTKGPELTNILDRKDENYIRIYTMDPRSVKPDGTMPPSDLSDHELEMIINYLKDKGKTRRP